jgi:hypothetical protein
MGASQAKIKSSKRVNNSPIDNCFTIVEYDDLTYHLIIDNGYCKIMQTFGNYIVNVNKKSIEEILYILAKNQDVKKCLEKMITNSKNIYVDNLIYLDDCIVFTLSESDLKYLDDIDEDKIVYKMQKIQKIGSKINITQPELVSEIYFKFNKVNYILSFDNEYNYRRIRIDTCFVKDNKRLSEKQTYEMIDKLYFKHNSVREVLDFIYGNSFEDECRKFIYDKCKYIVGSFKINEQYSNKEILKMMSKYNIKGSVELIINSSDGIIIKNYMEYTDRFNNVIRKYFHDNITKKFVYKIFMKFKNENCKTFNDLARFNFDIFCQCVQLDEINKNGTFEFKLIKIKNPDEILLNTKELYSVDVISYHDKKITHH